MATWNLYAELQKIINATNGIACKIHELYTIVQQIGANQTRILADCERILHNIVTFQVNPEIPLVQQLTERGLGGAHYHRMNHDDESFQLVCRGTLLCNDHPSVVEPAPARAPRGTVHVCRVCDKTCEFRPCGRVLIVHCRGGMCVVSSTRPHADGEFFTS